MADAVSLVKSMAKLSPASWARQQMHATLASGAAVPSSAAATLPATAAAVAPRAAAVLPATAASGGSGARLPPYVVACNNLDGRVRYGVEIKIPGQKGQMRVGSAFVNPESAWLAARVFQSSAIIDAVTGDIVLDHAASGLYNPLHMCSIFPAGSTCITEVCVVDVLVDILAKRSARIRARKPKRKRSSKADGGGGTGAGGARAAAVASASASAAASPAEHAPTRALGPDAVEDALSQARKYPKQRGHGAARPPHLLDQVIQAPPLQA